MAAVLKTADLHGFGGSNPSLSAINIENQCFTKRTPDFTPKNVKSGVLVHLKGYGIIPLFLYISSILGNACLRFLIYLDGIKARKKEQPKVYI